MPALRLVLAKATTLRGMANLRVVAAGVDEFSKDNEDRYPPSVAHVSVDIQGVDGKEVREWNWYDLRTMVAVKEREMSSHRSMSAYLRAYIADVKTLYCPGAPDSYKYLRRMWDAGDDWDNPDTPFATDVFSGTFCFYWNYQGAVQSSDGLSLRTFQGPTGPASGGRQGSKLLISDYFNFGAGQDNPPPCSFASCEAFDGAVARAIENKASYWSGLTSFASNYTLSQVMAATPKVALKAVFTDGHVETYSPVDTAPLWVILNRSDLTVRKPGDLGSTGVYFIPRTALY